MAAIPSRRRFLKTGLAAGAAAYAVPYFIPSRVLGAPGAAPASAPSNKVRFGAIGTGSRSPSDTGPLSQFADAQFVAVCDVDLARARTSAQRLNVAQDSIYQDYRKLLERKDIDAVVIASPDHWHAQHSIMAALAGKDVYCEKAMTLTVVEGRAMVNAVRNNKRV